jgi:hypothetical protein
MKKLLNEKEQDYLHSKIEEPIRYVNKVVEGK